MQMLSTTLSRFWFALVVSAIVFSNSPGLAQEAAVEPGTWELRVCAPPQSLPFSDIDETGYENRIAQLIADELGAQLSYDWVPFTPDLVNLHFAEGTCDLIIGVPDGFEQAATTVTYYQSPYVSVYRADAGFDVESLDDPDLGSLDIGIQGVGTPPHAALVRRGLSGNITQIYGDSLMSDDRHASLVQAVENGVIDIGFGWGPAIGYWSGRSETDMVVRPVEPQFEPPSSFQSIPMTMGVRRNDLAFRDLLNRAIANQWGAIQAVLAEYDIPLTPTPAPFVGEPLSPTADVALTIGVVLPTPTGGRTYEAAVNDIIGQAAFQGATLAEGLINSRADQTSTDVVLLHASAPSEESAARAAQRLIAKHDLSALVGGVGDGQAEALGTIAAEHGIAFLNVGSSDALLRARCMPTVFHVEPSPSTYLSALIELAHRQGPAGANETLAWFLVHLGDDHGIALTEVARSAILAQGDDVTGSEAVELNTPTYFHVAEAISASDADVVMVLLPAAEQLTFMGQLQDAGDTALLAPYPYQVTQTRNFLAATVEYGIVSELPRLLAWETTLADGRAADLNTRYTTRWGQPLDPTGWTAFEAVMVLAQAGEFTRSSDAEDLLHYLSSPTSTFVTSKGSLSFSSDGELPQQVYAVTVDDSKQWGINLSDKVAIASLTAVVNVDPGNATRCIGDNH